MRIKLNRCVRKIATRQKSKKNKINPWAVCKRALKKNKCTKTSKSKPIKKKQSRSRTVNIVSWFEKSMKKLK